MQSAGIIVLENAKFMTSDSNSWFNPLREEYVHVTMALASVPSQAENSIDILL